MAGRYPIKLFIKVLCIFTSIFINVADSKSTECLEIGRFYRNPKRPPHKIWSTKECSKYYLCLEGEVFNFQCSPGLVFDVKRQICDIEDNVDNCDITSVPAQFKETSGCKQDYLACNDGTCIPQNYFCDGSHDCPDGSDEEYCDQDDDPNAAKPCDPTKCKLPDCFCSKDGTDIPGNLEPSQIPQMIILTFDDAINYENWHIFQDLFQPQNRNPNGCPIKSTFYVSHSNNNYHQTQKLWNEGHEIAVHSITHRGPEKWWSYNATIEDWFDEMVGQANILHRFASVRLSQIRGMRVPFLQVGWNRQFLMMKEFGFQYDSSIVAPFSNPPLWPYTLNFKIPHNCSHQNCPTRPYSNIWEMVMNQLEIGNYTCAMIDSCPINFTESEVHRMLMHNFKRHYLTNRAPFGLYFHSSWFKKTENLGGFKKFLAEVLKHPDVWFVTNSQAIEWMKNPTPSHKLNFFMPWDCIEGFNKNEIACNIPNICKVYSRETKEEKYLYTCNKCPKNYPWLRNEFGTRTD